MHQIQNMMIVSLFAACVSSSDSAVHHHKPNIEHKPIIDTKQLPSSAQEHVDSENSAQAQAAMSESSTIIGSSEVLPQEYDSKSIYLPLNSQKTIKLRNSARALVEYAKKIKSIDIVHMETHKVLGTFPPDLVQTAKKELRRGEILKGLSATTPRWKVMLLIYVTGRKEPFVGLPVYPNGIRLNSKEPWSLRFMNEDGTFDPGLQEVTIGDEVHEYLENHVPAGAWTNTREYDGCIHLQDCE